MTPPRTVEIRRTGIDVPNNVWSLDIYGDPSVSGFDIGVGSIARQWDGTVPGGMWTKVGPLVTDWTAIYFGAQRALTTADLPDLSQTINTQLVDAVTNPFTAPPGLTSPDDALFQLKTGVARLTT